VQEVQGDLLVGWELLNVLYRELVLDEELLLDFLYQFF
jgi:hypothetical protein